MADKGKGPEAVTGQGQGARGQGAEQNEIRESVERKLVAGFEKRYGILKYIRPKLQYRQVKINLGFESNFHLLFRTFELHTQPQVSGLDLKAHRVPRLQVLPCYACTGQELSVLML
jgi:hypothetical protein